MLYDKRWDKKVNALTLGSFIAWLEQQPADGAYDWWDCDTCATEQFGNAIGMKGLSYDMPRLKKLFGHEPNGEVGEGYAVICGRAPWTFGAALARAKALQP